MDGITSLVIWVAFAIFCYAIAQSKGRNPWVAFAFGLLFGFFTIIYYWLSGGSTEYELQKAKKKVDNLQ